MPERLVIAYVLLACMAAATTYLLLKWRSHTLAERHRLSGRYRR